MLVASFKSCANKPNKFAVARITVEPSRPLRGQHSSTRHNCQYHPISPASRGGPGMATCHITRYCNVCTGRGKGSVGLLELGLKSAAAKACSDQAPLHTVQAHLHPNHHNAYTPLAEANMLPTRRIQPWLERCPASDSFFQARKTGSHWGPCQAFHSDRKLGHSHLSRKL